MFLLVFPLQNVGGDDYEKKTVDGIFFSLWALMFQTDVDFCDDDNLSDHDNDDNAMVDDDDDKDYCGEKTVDGIFFSLWTLMLQTDIIFRLQGLLFPHYIFQIKQCFQKGKNKI